MVHGAIEIVNAAAATYQLALLLANKPANVRRAGESVVYARYAKPVEEKNAAVGKMCEPREKSQRVRGRAREAGCDEMRGTSKRERVAMPPEARRAVEMLKSSRARIEEDMVCGFEWTVYSDGVV